MDTLVARIEHAATLGGSIIFVEGDTETPVPWADLLDDARAMAAALQHRGVGPGDHVALLGPTSRSLVTSTLR